MGIERVFILDVIFLKTCMEIGLKWLNRTRQAPAGQILAKIRKKYLKFSQSAANFDISVQCLSDGLSVIQTLVYGST